MKIPVFIHVGIILCAVIYHVNGGLPELAAKTEQVQDPNPKAASINTDSTTTTDSTTPETTTPLTITTTEDPIGTTNLPSATSGEITSSKYPKPYKYDHTETFTITVPDGYGINIYVEVLDLNGEAGDYLHIQSGLPWDNDGTGIFLTWNIQTPQNFSIANSNSVNIKFVVQERDDPEEKNKFTGFKLYWERVGELTTTTVAPSTNEPLPSQTDDSITIYLYGESPETFATNIKQFIEMLVSMATIYCTETNIPLEDSITNNNIIIKLVTHCPLTWPENDLCIQVDFAIPVKLIENSPIPYELTPKHLQEMWDTHQEENLKSTGLEEYQQPKELANFLAWLAFGLGALLFFICFIYFLWHYNFFVDRPKMRRLSEVDSICTEKARASDSSLFPSPHQLVPPLFDAAATDRHTVEKDHLGDKNSPLNAMFSTKPDWLSDTPAQNDDLFGSAPFEEIIYQRSFDNHSANNDEGIILRHPNIPPNNRVRRFISLSEEPQTDSIL